MYNIAIIGEYEKQKESVNLQHTWHRLGYLLAKHPNMLYMEYNIQRCTKGSVYTRNHAASTLSDPSRSNMPNLRDLRTVHMQTLATNGNQKSNPQSFWLGGSRKN